jgi:hypothetical protein
MAGQYLQRALLSLGTASARIGSIKAVMVAREVVCYCVFSVCDPLISVWCVAEWPECLAECCLGRAGLWPKAGPEPSKLGCLALFRFSSVLHTANNAYNPA